MNLIRIFEGLSWAKLKYVLDKPKSHWEGPIWKIAKNFYGRKKCEEIGGKFSSSWEGLWKSLRWVATWFFLAFFSSSDRFVSFLSEIFPCLQSLLFWPFFIFLFYLFFLLFLFIFLLPPPSLSFSLLAFSCFLSFSFSI